MSDSERRSKSKRNKSEKNDKTKKEKREKRDKGEKSEKSHSKKRSIDKVAKASKSENSDQGNSSSKQPLLDSEQNPKRVRLEKVSLSDLESIEYSIANISKHFELILENTPDSSLEESDCKDLEAFLRTKSPRICLAQAIKSLYNKGKMAIIDDLKNGVVSKVDHDLSESGMGPSLRSADEYCKGKSRKNIKEYSCGSIWPPPLPRIIDPALYKRVFTHKSFANKMYYLSRDELRQLHNERLEFLGDTILNSTISRLVYFRFPNMNEGDMTDVRSMLVSNDNIGKWALMYELDKQLKTTFDHSVADTTKGEMDKPRPKIIADIFEAYIAGIYLDSSNGGEIAETFLQSLAEPLLRVIEKRQKAAASLNTEAKNLLYVRIGSSAYRPEYHVVKQPIGNGDSFSVECRMGSDVIGIGKGPNIKEAGLRAAMAGLENAEMIEKYASIRRSMPRTAPVKAIHRLNPDGTVAETATEAQSAKTETLHSSSKDILYSMIGSSTLKPTYKSKFTEDRKYIVEVFMGDEQLGNGEGTIKKEAECQAADMALKNKALIDRWQARREETLKK
ncbi:hypothetical protein NADFUDRAFT_84136 [Nadsonia fulvescens var. elongata DSM 6958]|uniref:ribonuclease III n=1 Tax=Nadsonia fulvescens var. elongata DSM 6958 TaxID=857566 RepID=A0A1E3PDJ5_9ASCO|nr:hypothetical protein NADFUDRAFT_84136 [Nadsonia fulvescens var. elongata DSM 6958]